MTAILGVSCYFHDAAAALLIDGELVAAAEEERLSRVKHDPRFPEQAIAFCLAKARLEPGDLDYVAFYEKPMRKLGRILTSGAVTAPKSAEALRFAISRSAEERLGVRKRLARAAGVPARRVLFVAHHLSHAASAMYCSPFADAAVLTVDGVGEWNTTALGEATARWDAAGRSQIRLSRHIDFPHSLGLLYSAFTAYLGFDVNDGEYKVMGLAAYGEPRYADEVSKMIRLYPDGSFWLDMRYFAWHHSRGLPYTERFVDLLGPPRDPQVAFSPQWLREPRSGTRRDLAENRRFADIAASVQAVLERAILAMAHEAGRVSASANLCYAGGAALNGVANQRLLDETRFDRIFIPPAPGDGGAAVGAALHVHHGLLGKPRTFTMEHAYWGEEYDAGAIGDELRSCGMTYNVLDDGELVSVVARKLEGGSVGGWFQGRFEWGPRALGNRSIIASPCSEDMKERINRKIKYREPFRPFAPAILEDRAAEFVASDHIPQYPSRFMLAVQPLTLRGASLIPSASHFGTARIQLVRREWNQRFYDLINGFAAVSGVPALLNTSFNLRGEPIVSTPREALDTFHRSGLDFLVMGNFLVTKSDD